MADAADRHRSAFLEDAFEPLTGLESARLGREESPEDRDLAGRVFRAMHEAAEAEQAATVQGP